jgi:hypothetical protein
MAASDAAARVTYSTAHTPTPHHTTTSAKPNGEPTERDRTEPNRTERTELVLFVGLRPRIDDHFDLLFAGVFAVRIGGNRQNFDEVIGRIVVCTAAQRSASPIASHRPSHRIHSVIHSQRHTQHNTTPHQPKSSQVKSQTAMS